MEVLRIYTEKEFNPHYHQDAVESARPDRIEPRVRKRRQKEYDVDPAQAQARLVPDGDSLSLLERKTFGAQYIHQAKVVEDRRVQLTRQSGDCP
jgi:hypothetical protein